MARALGRDVFGREVALWSPYWYGGAFYASALLTAGEAHDVALTEDARRTHGEVVQAGHDESDPNAPVRRQCVMCAGKYPTVKASAVSKSGWVATCRRCGHRWEVRKLRSTEERERTQRIASVIRRGKRGGGQQLWRYDRRT